VSKSTMHLGRLSIAVTFAALVSLVAAPAHANHVPGATYRGTHSGGGTVQFTVSADGTRVTSYGVFRIPVAGGQTCFAATAPEFAGIPIVNHHFASTGDFVFTGSFPRAGFAKGTLAYRNAPSPCGTTATFTWTATTGSGPPPPPRPAAGPPYFRGGHDRVRFVRKSRTHVVVAARFRICEGGTPLRLFVVQRRRVAGKIVAASSFSRRLAGGKPVRELGGTRCTDYRTSWNLAAQFFGQGWITIMLRVVDPARRSSEAPQFAVRAPGR
jgi:hypothetical protein